MALDRASRYVNIALRAGAAVAVTALQLGPGTASAAPATGFGPLAGATGCLVAPGKAMQETEHCGAGNGLVGPNAVAVSPDGANVYVTAGKGGGSIAASFGAVAILKREPQTGAITESSCMSSDGTDGRDGASGGCTPMPSLLGADGVAVSPDGATVYVTSSASGSVIAFARNPASGALSRLGCFEEILRPGSPCVAANVFPGSSNVVASADGKALYIASPELGAVSALTASLLPPKPGGSGSASEPAPSVASLFGAPIQSLANPCIGVNGVDGTCAVGVATQSLSELVLSPDGKQLYASALSSAAIDIFTRDVSGAITQSGCLKTEPPPGLCSASSLKDSPHSLAVSPDGKNLYATDASGTPGRIDVLTRDPASGALTDASCVDFLPPPPEKQEESEEEKQQEKPEATPPGPCAHVPGLGSASVIAVSGDGSAVYTFGSDSAAFFARDPASGKLTETSCAAAEDKRCASVPALRGDKTGIAVSPDGHEVYFADFNANAVFAFTLGAAVTTARVAVSHSGTARVGLACPRALTLACTGRVQLARVLARKARRRRARRQIRRVFAGSSARYTIAPGGRATVSVQLARSARSLLLSRGQLRLSAVVVADPLGGGSGSGRHVLLRLGRY
jgi:DNA-binding beta-propeller fold protein YncE